MTPSKTVRRLALAGLLSCGTSLTPVSLASAQQPCDPCGPTGSAAADVSQYYPSLCPPTGMPMPMPSTGPGGVPAPLQFRDLNGPTNLGTPGSGDFGSGNFDSNSPAPQGTPSADGTTALTPPATTAPAPDFTGSGLADSTGNFDLGSSLARGGGAGASSFALADTPGMVGDFFGSGGTAITIPLTFGYDGVYGIPLGAGSNPPLGFDVNGNSSIDITTLGSATTLNGGQVQYGLAEPINPTDADLPQDFGFNNATYVGGTATSQDPGPVSGGEPFDLLYAYETTLIVPGAASSSVGRMKLAENVSPIPRDRFFVNYSFFDNVPFFDGVSVHRFTPGFEKTFGDDLFSFEFRTPMAVTVNSDLFEDNLDLNNVEFGDIFMTFKALLYQTDNFALSAGLSWTAPTADDLTISTGRGPTDPNGDLLIRVENGSVHLLPFVGALYVSDKNFFQGFLQLDVDAGESAVSFNLDTLADETELTFADNLSETSLMYIDIQAGRWLYRDLSPNPGNVTGLAVISELHINQSLEASRAIRSASIIPGGDARYQVGQDLDNVSVINALVGATLQYKRHTNWTLAYGTPIGNSADQQFDGEVRVLMNRFF